MHAQTEAEVGTGVAGAVQQKVAVNLYRQLRHVGITAESLA